MVKNALNIRHIILLVLHMHIPIYFILKRKNNSRKVLKRTFVTWYYVPVCDTCSPFQSRKKGSRPCFSQDMIVFDVVGLFLILNNFDSRCVLMYVTCSTHYILCLMVCLLGHLLVLTTRSRLFFVLLLFYYYYITISVYLITEIIKKLFELNR